jgi:hypothetical protein
MIDFAVVIDGVVSAGGRIEVTGAGLHRLEHGVVPQNRFASSTSGESLGFNDIP